MPSIWDSVQYFKVSWQILMILHSISHRKGEGADKEGKMSSLITSHNPTNHQLINNLLKGSLFDTMKVASKLLAVTAVLANAVHSNALKSSVRGELHQEADAELASRVAERRTLHPDKQYTKNVKQEGRRQEEETSTYWWLGKQSSEKDVVYKSNNEDKAATRASNGNPDIQHIQRAHMQEETSTYWWLSKQSSEKNVVYNSNNEDEGAIIASNGKDSVSVFIIEVDNNPDTSDLPYQTPNEEHTDTSGILTPDSLPSVAEVSGAPTYTPIDDEVTVFPNNTSTINATDLTEPTDKPTSAISTPDTLPPVAGVSGTPTYTPTGEEGTLLPNITSPVVTTDLP